MSAASIELIPPPSPLPVAWIRAIANSLADFLRDTNEERGRTGWELHQDKRSLQHNPRSRDYHPGGTIPPVQPTTELIYTERYAWGVIYAQPTHNIPDLVWHLTDLNAAHALTNPNQQGHAIDAFLRYRPNYGATPAPFRTAFNRHGKPGLRRNSEYVTDAAADALEQAASASTVAIVNETTARTVQAAMEQLRADAVTARNIDYAELLAVLQRSDA